jgi:hypothetical protein
MLSLQTSIVTRAPPCNISPYATVSSQGAATQCMQNMNLMTGNPEYDGIQAK